MIIVEAGERSLKSFDAKILFAEKLSQRGYSVVIDERTLPEDIERNQKFEAAPFLANVTEIDIDGVILIGAEHISDETLMSLRSYTLSPDTPVNVTGRFSDYQARVGSASKISFALGREANVIDLNDLQKQQILQSSIAPLTACASRRQRIKPATPNLFLFVPPELLEEPMVLPVLGAMEHLLGFDFNIITLGLGKEYIRKSLHSGLSVFGLVELAPHTFANMADIAVFFGDGVPGERMANFSLDLMRSGGVIVDCTTSAAFVSSGAPALRGPEDMAALPNYLDHSVLPNLSEIARQTAESDWLASNSFARLETMLKLPAPRSIANGLHNNTRTHFLPTNGNGLGHAQRCSLIASAMRKPELITFAAYPSCVNLINNKGFSCTPLVQKSENHSEEFANDLLNYLRLQRTVQNGDRLVFDGGYIFDSIYRTIIENSLDATWIRRGLWRAGQIKDSAFSRENAFNNVIVPSEAFDELNATYTFGDNVHQIGPIVDRSTSSSEDIGALKSRLAAQFDRMFDELIVTMLGGGVASDRSAQMQTLCALLERRPNCLHLIVVWPGSKVATGLSGWKNTRVVKTQNAVALCQASDLVISAAGYNSFHEVLYHAIPSIFIPQTAPYMDDQETRARAASDRGLASTVLGHEFMLLEREVNAFLEDGKSVTVRENLARADLPLTGNTAAAAIIEGETGNE